MGMENLPLKKLIIILIIAVFLLGTTTLPFASAEPVKTTETDQAAGFPYPGDDWAWSMIGTQYAHRRGEYGEDVVVAVLDTGIDYTHPDLEDKMWDGVGYDFVDNNEDPMDEHGHGTHVAGIIASVAPEAELMALRVIEESGGDWVDVSKAIEYARNNGADIISMSFGGQYSAFTPAFELQMERAYNWDDILHVAAAGNDDSDEKYYPAGYDSVISVSAVDSDKERADYSNHGDWIEVTAPGGGSLDQVYSTLPNESYGEKMGTSMACPFVSGVAALRRSLKPGESNDEVRDLLRQTAIDLDNEEYYGNGLVNAYRASGGEVPTPVQEVKADPADSSVNLSWNDPWHQGASPIAGFRIYRAEEGQEMEMIEEVDPGQYEYEDQGVENNVTYQYTVTAYNDEGESLDSEIVQATPREETVSPSRPREIDAEVLDDGVELTWKEPLDDGGSSITGYSIYRKESGEDEFEWLGEVDGEITEYLDKTVSPGTEYIYAVTSENEIGESEMSITDPVLVPEDHDPSPTEPSAPGEVSAELLDEGVEVTWEEPLDDGGSSITAYRIYRKEEGDSEFEFIGETESETFSYLDNTVSSGSEYTYAVTAQNEIGESEKAHSAAVSISEDYTPVPQEDEGWFDRISESDVPLIPLLIVGIGLLIVVVIALAKRSET
ncbi:MAG: S8 family serine peptidase [Candidatus Thermoplasmatota archaeon]